jgi:putative FmdB family regulatory protein
VPVYEYVCTVCGYPVEVMHSFTAEGPRSCERCGSPMRKALSTPAIVFKGSGWAKKDQRDKVHASSKATPAPAGGGDAGAAPVAAPTEGGVAASTSSSDSAGTTPSAPSTTAPAASATAATPSKGTAASSG